MYLPEDAINESVVATNAGYSGLSRDHYYRSRGVTEEASRLMRRQRMCGCQYCLKLEDGRVLTPASSDLKVGVTPCSSTVKLYTV